MSLAHRAKTIFVNLFSLRKKEKKDKREKIANQRHDFFDLWLKIKHTEEMPFSISLATEGKKREREDGRCRKMNEISFLPCER